MIVFSNQIYYAQTLYDHHMVRYTVLDNWFHYMMLRQMIVILNLVNNFLQNLRVSSISSSILNWGSWPVSRIPFVANSKSWLAFGVLPLLTGGLYPNSDSQRRAISFAISFTEIAKPLPKWKILINFQKKLKVSFYETFAFDFPLTSQCILYLSSSNDT